MKHTWFELMNLFTISVGIVLLIICLIGVCVAGPTWAALILGVFGTFLIYIPSMVLKRIQ